MYVYGTSEDLKIVVVFHRKKLIRFVIESSTKRKFAAKIVSADHSELSKRALEKCLLRNLVLPMRSKLLCLSVDELKNLTVKVRRKIRVTVVRCCTLAFDACFCSSLLRADC